MTEKQYLTRLKTVARKELFPALFDHLVVAIRVKKIEAQEYLKERMYNDFIAKVNDEQLARSKDFIDVQLALKPSPEHRAAFKWVREQIVLHQKLNSLL